MSRIIIKDDKGKILLTFEYDPVRVPEIKIRTEAGSIEIGVPEEQGVE